MTVAKISYQVEASHRQGSYTADQTKDKNSCSPGIPPLSDVPQAQRTPVHHSSSSCSFTSSRSISLARIQTVNPAFKDSRGDEG